MKVLLLTVLTIFSMSCNCQEKKIETEATEKRDERKSVSQIGEYVVETFQDSKGNMWFGTLGKGVAKYDGNKLVYLTMKDGLPSNRIVSIIEDQSGSIWFGTGAGLAEFDGTSFTNYSKKDGLCSDMISQLFIDSRGIFWIGTWNGVCQFDGKKFTEFPIPYPLVETSINQDTKDWITVIAEDAKGNIWFGRDGYGACKYNKTGFVHYTTKDGLNSNYVQSITEDKEGNIWFGTRVAEKDNADPGKRFGQGGLNMYNGKIVVNYPDIKGFNKSDVFEIYKDSSNDLWISTTSYGVYKYENNRFKNFAIPKSTMSFTKDQSGNIWLGCAGGLYRINRNGSIENVTTGGPWK